MTSALSESRVPMFIDISMLYSTLNHSVEALGDNDVSNANDLASLFSASIKITESSSYEDWVDTWLYRKFSQLNDRSTEKIQHIIQSTILSIDQMINRQLDEILHHSNFKKLESSWRGLRYLSDVEADFDENLTVKLKVLNASWREVGRDLTRAIEFDQSNLFKRIYSDEFDTPGGEPFGVLLGDYAISHRPKEGVPFTDVDILRQLSDVATASLCPVIMGVDASLFGVDSLRELGYPIDVSAVFKQEEYQSWNQLRAYEGTRFIGLALPDMLMRQPYSDDHTRREAFFYRERLENPDKDFLWGNSCYAFGSVLIRAFANTGWFADIRGGVHEFGEGGVVKDLLYARHRYEEKDYALRPAVNIQVDDILERELSELGFIPLCSYHSVEKSVFYSNNSLHLSKDMMSDIATANTRLSGMIQYMMCASRFGHYVKIIGRDKIGSFVSPEECQRIFQNWLNQYTTSSDTSSSELKARYPLSVSKVEIKEKVSSPGYYSCIMHLQPHFQLDQLVSSIKLITELAIGNTARDHSN